MDRNIQLIKAIMQIEGEIYLNFTVYNYDGNGGVKFTGYNEYEDIEKCITMNKSKVELINKCHGVKEIYDCYKKMSYFKEE